MRRPVLVAVAVLLLAHHAAPAFAQFPPADPAPEGRPPSQLTASVKVEVMPRQTQVFIDGYYAGIADDFDGAFQQLRIEPGQHDVQLYLPGYRLYTEKVMLQSGSTVKVRHTMERLGTGEAEPPRPTAEPRAVRVPPQRQGVAAPPRPGSPPAPPLPASPPIAPRPDGQAVNTSESTRSASGAITVRVQPGDAQVLIDGERWNTSRSDEPLVVQLAPGAHTIEIRKNGYRGYLTEVNVRGGETLPVNVSLAREP